MDCFCDCGCTAPGAPDFCDECYAACLDTGLTPAGLAAGHTDEPCAICEFG